MKGSRVVMVVMALLIGGCASQNFSMRNLPPETPAADNALAIDRAAAMAASQSAEPKPAASASGDNAAPAALTMTDAPSMYTYDPWERVNRFTYRFNARFDENVFLPVSNGYRRVPSPFPTGVHNFFGNLAEVDSVVNYTLQGRLGRGVRSLGRFVINSTIGIG